MKALIYTVLWTLLAVPLKGIAQHDHNVRKTAPSIAWQVMETDHFNLFHQNGSEQLIKDVLPSSINRLRTIEDKIGYRLSGRLDIYFYTSHSQMYSSYVAQDFDQNVDLGGTTFIQNSNINVYFPGSKEGLLNQISDAISENLISEMLFGGTVQERIKYATLLHLPSWFGDGLSTYLSRGWDVDSDNELRDAFNSSLFKSFNQLTPKQQILVGRSIWKYIEETEGSGSLQRILYLVRLTRKVETALYFVTKQTSKDLYENWYKSRSSIYAAELKRRMPSQSERLSFDFASTQLLSLDLSPEGNKIATAIYEDGKHSVVVFDRETGEKKTIFKNFNYFQGFEPDPREILVRWKDNDVVFILQNALTPILHEVNLEGGIISQLAIELEYINWMDYQNDEIVFSGSIRGISNLYLYQPDYEFLSLLTDDSIDDLYPTFDQNGNIYYSKSVEGDRNNPGEKQLDIFYLIRQNKEVLSESNVSKTRSFDEKMPVKLSSTYLSFLSNRNGIVNAFAYNVNEEIYALSDYQSNITWQSTSRNGKRLAEVLLKGGILSIYVSDIEGELNVGSVLHPTNTLTLSREVSQVNNTKSNSNTERLKSSDSSKSRIYFQSAFPIPTNVDSLERIEESARVERQYTIEDVGSKQITLQPGAMYTRFDNSNFLTPTSAAFSNPKAEVLNKVGFVLGMRIEDQFKNNEFDLKMRSSFRFDRFQFSLNYTNRSGKLVERISYSNDGYVTEESGLYFKRNLRLLQGSIQKPLNNRSVVSYFQEVRHDTKVELGSEKESFQNSPISQLVSSQGVGYRYNTTYHHNAWTFSGLDIRVKSLWLTGIGNGKNSLNNSLIVGYGKKLTPNLHWISRLHAGHSLGKIRSVYFLGGATNQFSPTYTNNPVINEDVAFYQPVYGVRNFGINIRNGNTYGFLNTEIFAPVYRWLGHKPIRNNVVQNLWFVVYGDVGTAWYGKSPYDRLNPANKSSVAYGPLNIVIYNTKNPLVFSFGSGLRTKILGYDVRYDIGYTVDNGVWNNYVQSFSIGKPF